MGAAELLDYDRSRIRGLVLEEGAPTSHVTIVARALGIATVGRALPRSVSLVENGDAIIVDGETGDIHIRPTADVELAYAEKVQFRAERQKQYRLLRDVPSVTRDGQPVSLMINAGLLVDLPHVEESGAEGIGLFRTELEFMVAETLPRMEQQAALYKAVLDGGWRASGDLPHARYRRRQGAALSPRRRRGKPRARLARDPAGSRSARAAAHSDSRAAARGGRPRACASCCR